MHIDDTHVTYVDDTHVRRTWMSDMHVTRTWIAEFAVEVGVELSREAIEQLPRCIIVEWVWSFGDEHPQHLGVPSQTNRRVQSELN